MARQECREITEWIEEQVSRPIEEWEERQEERCKNKKCNWWTLCLNKLVCWFVTILVKVVRWVVVTVGKWVARTVCTIVGAIIDTFIDIAVGLWDIFAGIFTWDWPRVWDGFVRIVEGLGGLFFTLVRVVLLGDTVDFIREEIQKKQLRDYVRDLLEDRFARDPEALVAAMEAIGVDHGAFGLRLRGTATRTFVRSDRFGDNDGMPDEIPQLIRWHENSALGIDIRKLAGYDWDSFWKRGRPEVVDADEDDIDTYILDRGGKTFRIYAMSESLLRSKANTAEERARDLGVMLEFDTAEKEVTDPAFVNLTGGSEPQDSFNVAVLGRTDETVDAVDARAQLCHPVGGGAFGYTSTFIGYASRLDECTCLDTTRPCTGSETSGVSFLDRLPDFVFKYVFVHELGHYFGLCHVDGLNRIMYTANKNENTTWWDWWVIPEYVYLEGGPRFILDEAKRAWDYIVAGFPTECLTRRAH